MSIPEKTLSELGIVKDGLYAIDRGDGWVRGLDEDIIVRATGTTGPANISLSREVEDSSKIITETKASAGFNYEFINASFEIAFEVGIGIKNSINTKYSYDVEDGQRGYGLLYKHYHREDLVRVKNNKIIDKAIRYRFSGITPVFVSCPKNQSININNHKFTSPKCLLGEKNETIQLLDTLEKVENIGLITKDTTYTTGSYSPAPETIYLYFSVSSNGIFKIESNGGEVFSIYKSNSKNRSYLKLISQCQGKGYKKNSIYQELSNNQVYALKISCINGVVPKVKFSFVGSEFSQFKSMPIYELEEFSQSGGISPDVSVNLRINTNQSTPVGILFKSTLTGFNPDNIQFTTSGDQLIDGELYHIEKDEDDNITLIEHYKTLKITSSTTWVENKYRNSNYLLIVRPESQETVSFILSIGVL